MSKPVIEIEGLGKSYVVPAAGQRWAGDFTDAVMEFWGGIRRGRLFQKREENRFWALRDLTFTVEPGEVVALAGHNGAGKSTLLKVLSRITQPNEGRALLRGRVGSLLEVGTGFHQDLSGRENVYLAGTILGMSRAEVAERFDEIVAFAEMDQFIDMQVKRYSSGMYLRLAFAVAAHLSTEILLIDEALAVGDVNFQRKCMGKMGQLANNGRTVLFVSHSVSAMRTLCTRGILLDRGRLIADGPIESIIKGYLSAGVGDSAPGNWSNSDDRFDDPCFQPMRLWVEDSAEGMLDAYSHAQSAQVHIEARIREADPDLMVGISVTTPEGIELFRSEQRDCQDLSDRTLEAGLHHFVVQLPERLFNEGDYQIEVIACLFHKRKILEPGEGNPSVPLTIRGGFGKTSHWIKRRPGLIAPELDWKISS